MKPDEAARRLKSAGWHELPGKKTSHRRFKHTARPGKLTVPFHKGRDINPVTFWI